MSTFLWSDTHFHHRGIIDYCKRPYASVEEMNQGLIERWNLDVRNNDTVYHLGDFGFGGMSGLLTVFEQLNGIKHLVRGNHDYQNEKVFKLPWHSQHDLLKLKHDGKKYILCHYPLETWEGAHKGYLHFHGHCHGSLKRVIGHRFDVGVDVFGYPVALEDLEAMALATPFSAQDHHGD